MTPVGQREERGIRKAEVVYFQWRHWAESRSFASWWWSRSSCEGEVSADRPLIFDPNHHVRKCRRVPRGSCFLQEHNHSLWSWPFCRIRLVARACLVACVDIVSQEFPRFVARQLVQMSTLITTLYKRLKQFRVLCGCTTSVCEPSEADISYSYTLR